MNRTYTMARGIKFQNLIIDEEGKVNARQSLVFRNECSLEEINKLIGTSFSPNSLLFEGQKRLEAIFAKLRELNIERASVKAMKNWIKIIKEIKKEV